MTRATTPRRLMAQLAALARIEEMGGRARPGRYEMSTDQLSEESSADRELKQTTRAMWALGDYHRFATETVWTLGQELVAACGIEAGERVLDVAAGTGNVAIRAAERGALVVASDLTPENFDAGRREAGARGVELEWVEADAEALPFGDGEFDVVTSCLGAIFAPDHRRVAAELLRVCRPGGRIGMVNFTPEGLGGEFFGLFGRYAPPPPPDAEPPLMWGSEQHVRALFGDEVESLEMSRREYVERSASPEAYRDLFASSFGPIVGLMAALPPERAAAFERDFLDYATRENRGEPGGVCEYPYEYLLVVARRRRA